VENENGYLIQYWLCLVIFFWKRCQ